MGSARLDGDAFGRRSLEYDYLQLRDENVHLKKHAREQEEKAKKLATRLSRVINEKIKQGATASELGPRRHMVEMEQKVEDLDNKVRALEKQNMQLKGKLQVSRQLITTATQFQSPYSKVQPRVNSGLRRPIQKPRPFGNESAVTAASLQKKMGASDLVHAPPYVVSLIREAKEEIEKLEAVVESQRLQLAEVAEQARFREAELQTELSEMKEQVNQGQVRYIQGNVDILSLRRDAEHCALREATFKSELEALDKKMEKVSAHNSSLLGEVDQLASQLRTEQAKNLQLEENLSACEAMQKALAELEQRLADLQQENEILKTANEQLLNSIEGSDVDENKWHEEAGALKLQVTQLEAIIKSDNDEKAALEKELAERIELYQSLQEEHGNLEKAHAEITARLETVQKDLQDLQKDAHSKSVSMDRIILPESSTNAFGTMLINGLSPSGPASSKCLDKEVQATVLENGYEEMTKLKEEQQRVIEKERLRIKELQSLLTEKAKKIEVLEKHLAHIPSKQVQVTEVCAPNEADDEHCLSLVRKGQSFLEIHLNKITFVAWQDALEGSAPPPVFATWTFADFQPQSTPVATGKFPEFNCTARYAVAVDSTFIDYLHKDSVQIQVQAVHGADIHSLGTCQIALRPALQHPFKCNYAQAALVGVQDGQHKHFVGTLSYWVRFLPAADPARRLLGLSVPMSPPKVLPHSGHQSKKQNGEIANAAYNELKVNVVRCTAIPSKQGHLQKSLYCCYQLCDFPEQQTVFATAVDSSVDFHHIYTFPVKTDSRLHKQLLSQSLVLLLLEEDAEPGSFVGKASVPLSPLAIGQAVQGPFLLFSPWGEDAGSVELEIAWEHEYNPPRKPVPRARSKNGLGGHKSKRMPSAQYRASASRMLPTTSDMTKDQQPALRPQEAVISERKNALQSSHSRKGSRERGERAESSSLTSVSSLSPASGSISAPAGVKGSKVQRQDDGNNTAGVNNSLAEESQSLEEFSNGQVVVVKTAALKRSDTFKISDAAVFSVINLGFLPGAAVLKNKSIEMLFVEFQFLDCSPEELETPVALPKPKPPQRIAFNFRKVVHLDSNRHQERREALASMMTSKNPKSAIIKFTVVSEPLGKNKNAECQDVGFAIIDLKQILKYGKDIIEEDVDVLDARSNMVIGKLNVSIEILAALKRILAESKHTSRVSS
ncbi:protein fantom isoform X3 [Rhipicephalus sanguineus]|uniref:protein fantom isoform X3 n=1 Tax=Rhipicephalus sanguineus TaxID=34632 RepID=UPI001893F9AA|nr:protein fantom isoform X3 [Rhipicephalus sanguineus]